MNKRLICGLLLVCTFGAASAQAEPGRGAIRQPGPMEYQEVTAIWGLADVASARQRLARQLLQMGKQEQLRSLSERQRHQLEMFRTGMANAQAPKRGEREAERAAQRHSTEAS